jgi:hypothetical protein
MKLYWFEFDQNNSGGSFVGPETVWVQAPNADAANDIAEDHGVYFDGCAYDRDCECCGDRWYRVDDSDYDRKEKPQWYYNGWREHPDYTEKGYYDIPGFNPFATEPYTLTVPVGTFGPEAALIVPWARP